MTAFIYVEINYVETSFSQMILWTWAMVQIRDKSILSETLTSEAQGSSGQHCCFTAPGSTI